MHVSRIGFTPLKGTRHTAVGVATLELSGPVGDRVFCLVDPERRRVLRTVENPSLLQVRSVWDGHTLGIEFPDGSSVLGTPYAAPQGELKADYWGRTATVVVQDGFDIGALSQHLGQPVELARAAPSEVVYGGSVSIVTTSELQELAVRAGDSRLGRQDARFRATVTLDTGSDDAEVFHAGTRINLGRATVEVRGPIPRCAVVDLDPVTGQQTAPVLRTVAGYRRGPREVYFGVDARVVVPGAIRQGDPAVLEV
ncbi:MAG: MOSC domain-containing protein [Actinomycetota bacterium]|nr:MOSC domain-containing protein [Actinomycetota bacterium]